MVEESVLSSKAKSGPCALGPILSSWPKGSALSRAPLSLVSEIFPSPFHYPTYMSPFWSPYIEVRDRETQNLYMDLLLFRETLFQWAFCTLSLTSSAPVFSLTKVKRGLNLSKPVVISRSSWDLISATFISAHHSGHHEKFSSLASVYLHSLSKFSSCIAVNYVSVFFVCFSPLSDCWRLLKHSKVLSSALFLPGVHSFILQFISTIEFFGLDT